MVGQPAQISSALSKLWNRRDQRLPFVLCQRQLLFLLYPALGLLTQALGTLWLLELVLLTQALELASLLPLFLHLLRQCQYQQPQHTLVSFHAPSRVPKELKSRAGALV